MVAAAVDDVTPAIITTELTAPNAPGTCGTTRQSVSVAVFCFPLLAEVRAVKDAEMDSVSPVIPTSGAQASLAPSTCGASVQRVGVNAAIQQWRYLKTCPYV